ncbi:hypothetical protein LCGC14_0972800 [marine sediment metagenome]|uniref:Uncharacterized protein n=1 Tax=marine sediment metagenome TaxID=412755 RepID=A0A0F9RHI8_9ZZZZ
MIIKLNKRIRKLNRKWFDFIGVANNSWIVTCRRLANGRYKIESLDGNMSDSLNSQLLFD